MLNYKYLNLKKVANKHKNSSVSLSFLLLLLFILLLLLCCVWIKLDVVDCSHSMFFFSFYWINKQTHKFGSTRDFVFCFRTKNQYFPLDLRVLCENNVQILFSTYITAQFISDEWNLPCDWRCPVEKMPPVATRPLGLRMNWFCGFGFRYNYKQTLPAQLFDESIKSENSCLNFMRWRCAAS